MKDNNTHNAAKFNLGQIVATPGAIAAIEQAGDNPAAYLAKHQSGNWGVMDNEDKAQNDRALETGARLFSAYLLSDQTKIWVITEAVNMQGQRWSTTILLPSEY